ncbi:arsenate-mycothiol transferase ArsC [Salinimicrobium soli]|uniref:arsenate-mycothiol transferase ArsC n=1 Tax=Salinimicrobium soli TaxID=1254399 RepID=UPI003AAD0058
MAVYLEIQSFLSGLEPEGIPAERKEILQSLIQYLQEKVRKNEEIKLNFICTHNSRRSHLSQVWAQTLAHHFQIMNVVCYSGGTEATALYAAVLETLKKSGFQVQNLSQGNNPVYAIKYSEDRHPVIGFSKKVDDPFNPRTAFAAVMTCSEADEACPVVTGAEIRIPLTYEDPKKFDAMPQQAEMYLERSNQIATELMYVFSRIRP